MALKCVEKGINLGLDDNIKHMTMSKNIFKNWIQLTMNYVLYKLLKLLKLFLSTGVTK